ncbi:MAG: 16S rRNA (guanine(527)-N(7))-methyltransferase RsmG [Spirochaetaceae bacterium]|nr:MAG: 16S rRNA (guanine(527)-N(7))-methyltransferase RsmG [Spirochaetaceae bacterium]
METDMKEVIDSIMNADPADILRDGLSRLGLSPPVQIVTGLLTYIGELERWNKRFGFVNADTKNEIVLHVTDALSGVMLLRSLPDRGPVLDLGSGAGLPGLPLAFLLPERPFVLCERKTKEAAFLRNIVLLCGLKNVTVIENLADTDKPAGLAVFRAVKTVRELLPFLTASLAENGLILAYKGTLEKTVQEVADLGSSFTNIHVYKLAHPFLDHERHAVVLFLEKMKSAK